MALARALLQLATATRSVNTPLLPQAALRAFSSSSTTTATAQGTAAAAPQLHVVVEPLGDALEGVSVVTLARADARNAIGRQLLRELREAVDLLRQERTTRCVVLRSSVPGVFCAGADLKERAKMTQAETLEFVGLLRRTMSEVQVCVATLLHRLFARERRVGDKGRLKVAMVAWWGGCRRCRCR